MTPSSFSEQPCVCIPILLNQNSHQSKSEVIALYIRFIDGTFTLVNFSHPDAPISDIKLSEIVLHSNSLVLNKKLMLYHGFNYGIDLNSYLQYYIDDFVDVSDFMPKITERFNIKMNRSSNLGYIIPLSKSEEWAETITKYMWNWYKPDKISPECKSYCNDFVNVFYQVEQNVICFDDTSKLQNYQWQHTVTSRPSNAWDNFNFTAMNKTDGSRDVIHSQFEGGKILQFDYDAFHIKLLAKILEYDFGGYPYDVIKRYLISDVDISVIKTKCFQNLYGGITNELMGHPFFMQVQAMIDELNDGYTTNGFIGSWFYGKRFRDIQDSTPNKIFNYYLQSLETEYNVLKMQSILPILTNKQSKLIMYMYDAFIFDIHPDEMSLIDSIHRVFETDGMSVKTSIGDTFGSLILI